MTDQKILGALAKRSYDLLLKGAGLPVGEERTQVLSEALRCSLAGWVLHDATPDQMIEIWTMFRKPENN